MRQFKTVLKFEIDNYFRNKSFVITTLILMIVIAGVIIVPALIPGFLGEKKRPETLPEEMMENLEQGEEVTIDHLETLGILVEDKTFEDVEELKQSIPAQWKTFESEEELKNAVENERVKAGFILKSAQEFTYVVNNKKMGDFQSDMFEDALKNLRKFRYLEEKGLSREEILEADNMQVTMHEKVLGKDGVNSYAYTYILIFLVYFLILLYGQMIAVSVTNEKSNRAIEILVTSVSPNSLICGKVLAGALAGLIQAVLLLGTGFLSYSLAADVWGGKLDMIFKIPGTVMAAFIVFQLLSYTLYSFIYGALGALVSKTEDISKSATPITLIYIVSFFIAMFGMPFSDHLVMKIASFVPFTSGNAMFVRIAMGHVELWEIAISFILLAGTCVLVGILAAKLFRFGTLHYGNPVKLSKALKNVCRK